MKLFEYTPHIYTKEDWKTHKKYFIALQLIPLILTAIFSYFSERTDAAIILGFIGPLFSIWYWVWTGANIFVYVLAKVENDRHQRKLKEELK